MDVEGLKKEKEQDKKEEQGLDKKVYVFEIQHKGCGKSFVGSFTNKILTNNEKGQRDIVGARMREGLPYEAFSPDARLRQDMISHLVMSLTERPDWAKDLGELEDLNIIGKIYEEVMKHEDNFRESGKD